MRSGYQLGRRSERTSRGFQRNRSRSYTSIYVTAWCRVGAVPYECRPLAVNELSDPEIFEPLTPNHLLTLKPKILLPPPGESQRTDLYSKKWWRRVQYLTNEFWLQWRREFLHNLQSQQKWISPQRNLSTGNLVILKENDLPRNRWPLAKVTKVIPTKMGW